MVRLPAFLTAEIVHDHKTVPQTHVDRAHFFAAGARAPDPNVRQICLQRQGLVAHRTVKRGGGVDEGAGWASARLFRVHDGYVDKGKG